MRDHAYIFSQWRIQVQAVQPRQNVVAYRSSDHIPTPAVPLAVPLARDELNIAIPAEAAENRHAWGVWRDGMLVAWAFCHPPRNWPGGVLWVGVQTLSAYRRKGYALASLLALRNAVEFDGESEGTLVYLHAADNHASGSLARAAGLIEEPLWKD